MFSSMYESLVNKQKNIKKDYHLEQTLITTKRNIYNVHSLINATKEGSNNHLTGSTVTSKSTDSLTITTNLEELSIGCGFDGIKSKNYSILTENITVEDPLQTKLFNQIDSLHCLFTWDLKKQTYHDIVTHIKNKYGEDNIDISIPEFSFVRFISNLIISYELYKNGESDASDLKILEIGNWLDKLDEGSDDFYLSINTGLKYIRMANFIYMLFSANETRGLRRLFDELIPFDNLDNKSKAVVYSIRAIILIEYGGDFNCFKNACTYADKACELDPKTLHWYHIYSLVLIAQRQFVNTHTNGNTKEEKSLHTNKFYPTENEINLAIRRAVMSSDGKHTSSINSLLLTFLQLFSSNDFQIEFNGLSILKKIVYSKYEENNIVSNLEHDMKVIVKKHRNGEDVIPYLTVMVPKYNQQDRWKIMAQICSYTILFTNCLRSGIEQFLILIEESEISTDDLIIRHHSPFIYGSRIFNLAELIYNEIKLATINLSGTPLTDILFYYKMFFKIEKMFNFKMKVIDPYMKVNLVSEPATRIINSNINYQNVKDSPRNKNNLLIKFTNSSIPYNEIESRTQSELNKTMIVKINEHGLKSGKNKTYELDKIQFNKTHMHFQTSNIISLENGHPNNNDLNCVSSNSKQCQLQLETEQYYTSQHISTSSKDQCNVHNLPTQDANNFYKTYSNENYFQQYVFSNSIPSLIDLKFDVILQSLINRNSIITNSITANPMVIDTSLTKLPRSLTSQTMYKAYLKNILQNYPYSFKIYTDASKVQNNVGIAVVSDKDEYSYKLTSEYSSSDAEAVAILRALDYALSENFYDFVILSDSLTTLICIQTLNTASSDVIKSILCLLHAHHLKGNSMHFIWIPSHNAIEGNEKADQLAKQIAMSTTAITYSHNSFKTNILS